MSRIVKNRLRMMGLLHETDHDERVQLDKLIEEKTGKYCDIGVLGLTDREIRELLAEARRRLRRKKPKEAELMVV